MKKIFLLCLVFFTVGAKAQETIKLPLKDSLVIYESTVQVPGTADVLYEKALKWAYQSFKGDHKSYLSKKDKKNHKISGKVFSLYLSGGNNDADTYLVYNVDITLQNGAYSYKIYDISGLYGTTTTPVSKAYSQYLHGEIHKNSLVESKRTAMVRLEAQFVFVDQYINGSLIGLKQAMSK